MTQARARKIHIFDGDGINVSGDYKNAQIEPEESDDAFASHQAMRDGTANDWALTAEVAEDNGVGKPWKLMQSPVTRGSEYPFFYSPYVDDLADVTVATPAYQATAIVTLPSGSKFFGDESTRSPRKVPTVEIEWPLLDEPVEITTPPVFTP